MPKAVEADVLIRSRRRCCLCFFWDGDDFTKNGQIAHIDRDSSNASADNLVYLCLEHHNQYDSRQSQAKNVTEKEVRHARMMLDQAFADRTAKVLIEVKLGRQFDEFSAVDLVDLVKTVQERFGSESGVVVRDLQRGSVLLTIEVDVGVARRIMQALDAGELESLDVLDAMVTTIVEPNFEVARKRGDRGNAKKMTGGLWFACPSATVEIHGTTGPDQVEVSSSNGFVSGWDATCVQQKIVDLPVPEIPDVLDKLPSGGSDSDSDARFKIGESVSIRLSVANTGPSAASTFQSRLYLDSNTDSVRRDSDGIRGGESDHLHLVGHSSGALFMENTRMSAGIRPANWASWAFTSATQVDRLPPQTSVLAPSWSTLSERPARFAVISEINEEVKSLCSSKFLIGRVFNQ